MSIIIQHSTDLNVAKQIAKANHISFEVHKTHIRFLGKANMDLAALRGQYALDFNYLPALDFSQIKLFVSDMDSTLIRIECIDEIADFAHVKPQVAMITERTMQGELDFDSALIERVALLKNLDKKVLDRVYTERLQLSQGATTLLDFLKTKNIKSGVISGGFDYFTQRLAADLGLEHNRANRLEIADNKLTGKICPPIVNAQAKADFVTALSTQYALSKQQIMVAGDGANDLLMMKKAGVSIAFHAKPLVIKYANIVISVGGLDKIIDFFDG